MNIISIIFLIFSIFTGSIALALLIGGVMSFQNLNNLEQRKPSYIEMADGLLFSSFFTAIFNVFANWNQWREGRIFIYWSGILIGITVVLFHFVKFK